MKTSILVALISSSLAAIAYPVIAAEAVPFASARSNQTDLLIAQSSTPGATALDFVNYLASGDYDAAFNLYDGVLRGVRGGITAQSLASNWEDLTNELGSLQNVSIRSRAASLDNASGDSSLVILTCEFEGGQRDLFVVLSDTNQIVEYSVAESP